MTSCTACGAPAIAQWGRRPTDGELAAEHARVNDWRDEMMRDGLVPSNHDFGPLAEATDITVPVFGCAAHAIHLDAAALVHAATCTAPNPAHHPGCDCTPEPAPEAEPELATVTLPTGWTIPAA